MSPLNEKKSGFRVIIVGGGIGGLALAISLQRAGIDFVLLEKAKELDPQVGASIGILPNGARILDQLGCFDKLAELTVDMKSTASHNADGSLIGSISDTLSLVRRRTNYPVIFIDRQWLLHELARCITVPSSQIMLETAVKSVDQYSDKTVVTCADGTTLEADIVVGSDGVHSIVRQEMWRHADSDGKGEIFSKDKKAMSAEYKCLFGISTKVEGMEPGQTDRTYAHGLSTLSYVGKDGRVFWFVFIKMDKVYYPPDIPRFNSDDVEAAIEANGSVSIRQGKITIADLYRERVTCNLVAIEEAEYEHWSYGRLMCIGDSIHKMTPNLGAGASSALESIATLSNVIVPLARAPQKPTVSALRSAFEECQRQRALRLDRAMKMTNKLTRVQALDTKKDAFIARYISPLMEDHYAEVFSSFVIGAPIIDHIPIPQRSLHGTMPFNPRQGWGYEESTLARILRASPLLIFAMVALVQHVWAPQWLRSILPTMPAGHHGFSAAVWKRFDLRYDLAYSITFAATYGLWLIESARMSNKASLIRFPLLFGIAWHYLGIEVALSTHLFLLYVQSPVEKFRASDMRLTDVSYTCSTGPLVFLLGMLPELVTYVTAAIYDKKYDWSNLWQYGTIHPQLLQLMLLSLTQLVVARLLYGSTIRSDRISAVDRDVNLIRWTTGFLIVLTSASWLNHLVSWGTMMMTTMTKTQHHYVGSNTNLMQSLLSDVFGPSGIAFTMMALFWLVLVSHDLSDAGMLQIRPAMTTVLGCLALICVGPGAMLLLGWQLREEVLHSRRHRDAVVKP